MPYFGIPIRNGLPIGLGSVAGFGVQQFSPADLFSAGEQGAWYDPSDLTTLFTDSAGTTPVTAVEQFVGLMLDKSKGLVLGSELVTNGTFNSDVSGWTAGSTATISWDAGRMKITNIGAAFGYSYQSFPTVIGKTYKISANISVGTAGTVYLRAGISELSFSYFGRSTTTDGVLSGVFVATATTSYVHILNNNVTNAYSLSDNISIKLLPGNHATQTTSAKRPKLAARYNLLTYTEQFDNGVWAEFNGLYAGSKFTPDVSNAEHRISFGLSTTASTYTHQYRVKAAGYNWCFIGYANSVGSRENAFFDLQNGATGTIPVGATAKIVSVGGGVYDIFLTTATGTFGSNYTLLGVSNANNVTSFAANGVDGIEIFRADLRPASQATGLIGPTYQRVVDAATYDAVGFLPYLEFNGLSWSMSTNSIDFSAGDKVTAWAGVRRLGTGTALLLELSADLNANAGTFSMSQDAGTSTWTFSSKGTIRADATSGSSYPSPITTVNAGIGDIAGDVTTLRVNGTQVATSATNQGTGNFGNYPLFIGARNNASFFFTGWLTSLIVRGAQSTQSQIEATESWVNGKTGAY
jgi:hypothetical protein